MSAVGCPVTDPAQGTLFDHPAHGYRDRPDAMVAAAAAIGCRLEWPHINRGWTWEADPAVILVVNNATDSDWWQALAWQATGMCLIFGRLRWKSTLQGQHALYFGPDRPAFDAAFAPFGVTGWRAG